jgi:hypothetical protein
MFFPSTLWSISEVLHTKVLLFKSAIEIKTIKSNETGNSLEFKYFSF